MLVLDSFALVSILAFTALWLVGLACAPRQDLEGRGLQAAALIFAGTILAYAAGSLWVFLTGWMLTALPYFAGWCGPGKAPKASLWASAVALGAGAALNSLPGKGGAAGLCALALAALMRMGIVPFHFAVTTAFENPALLMPGLLFHSHLGAYLLIRFAVPLYPGLAGQAISLLSVLAILTALYTAIRGLAEQRPRRILALLFTSQTTLILAGLENLNAEGITGALLQWWVVSFAANAMIGIYRGLEARSTEVSRPAGFLGLAHFAPRMAVFFAVAGLALTGLPGTLGFTAELLVHGSLESHPVVAIGLPLAAALNAITVFRLFATLFLGRRATQTPAIPDARTGERLALAASVIFLVAGGIAPGFLVGVRAHSAEWIASLLAGR